MRCAKSFPKALPNRAKIPWNTPNIKGINHLWEGLSSALIKPNECVPAVTVRQMTKRRLKMMDVVDIN